MTEKRKGEIPDEMLHVVFSSLLLFAHAMRNPGTVVTPATAPDQSLEAETIMERADAMLTAHRARFSAPVPDPRRR